MAYRLDQRFLLDGMPSRSLTPPEVYGHTKLANVLFAAELNRRLRDTHPNVSCVSVHPGYVASSFYRPKSRIVSVLTNLAVRITAKSVSEGARPVAFAAMARSVVGGGYIADCVHVRPMSFALDRALAGALYDRSLAIFAGMQQARAAATTTATAAGPISS